MTYIVTGAPSPDFSSNKSAQSLTVARQESQTQSVAGEPLVGGGLAAGPGFPAGVDTSSLSKEGERLIAAAVGEFKAKLTTGSPKEVDRLLTQAAIALKGDENSEDIKKLKTELRRAIMGLKSPKVMLAENGDLATGKEPNKLPEGAPGGYHAKTNTILLNKDHLDKDSPADIKATAREEVSEAVVAAVSGKTGTSFTGDAGDRLSSVFSGKSAQQAIADEAPGPVTEKARLNGREIDVAVKIERKNGIVIDDDGIITKQNFDDTVDTKTLAIRFETDGSGKQIKPEVVRKRLDVFLENRFTQGMSNDTDRGELKRQDSGKKGFTIGKGPYYVGAPSDTSEHNRYDTWAKAVSETVRAASAGTNDRRPPVEKVHLTADTSKGHLKFGVSSDHDRPRSPAAALVPFLSMEKHDHNSIGNITLDKVFTGGGDTPHSTVIETAHKMGVRIRGGVDTPIPETLKTETKAPEDADLEEQQGLVGATGSGGSLQPASGNQRVLTGEAAEIFGSDAAGLARLEGYSNQLGLLISSNEKTANASGPVKGIHFDPDVLLAQKDQWSAEGQQVPNGPGVPPELTKQEVNVSGEEVEAFITPSVITKGKKVPQILEIWDRAGTQMIGFANADGTEFGNPGPGEIDKTELRKLRQAGLIESTKLAANLFAVLGMLRLGNTHYQLYQLKNNDQEKLKVKGFLDKNDKEELLNESFNEIERVSKFFIKPAQNLDTIENNIKESIVPEIQNELFNIFNKIDINISESKSEKSELVIAFRDKVSDSEIKQSYGGNIPPVYQSAARFGKILQELGIRVKLFTGHHDGSILANIAAIGYYRPATIIGLNSYPIPISTVKYAAGLSETGKLPENFNSRSFVLNFSTPNLSKILHTLNSAVRIGTTVTIPGESSVLTVSSQKNFFKHLHKIGIENIAKSMNIARN